MCEYTEEGYEPDYEEDLWDKADRAYDEMRDDFLMIQNEDDAKSCIERYPRMVDKFLPKKYKYLVKEV